MAYEQPAGQPNLLGDDEEEDDLGKQEAYAREPVGEGWGGDPANEDDYKDDEGEPPEHELDTVSEIRQVYDDSISRGNEMKLSAIYRARFQNLFLLSPGQRKFVHQKKHVDLKQLDDTLKRLRVWVEDEKTAPDKAGAESEQAQDFEQLVPGLDEIEGYLAEMVRQFEAPPLRGGGPPEKQKPPPAEQEEQGPEQTVDEFLADIDSHMPGGQPDKIDLFRVIFDEDRPFGEIMTRYHQWLNTPQARRNPNFSALFAGHGGEGKL